jgi:branched-subunit amino acid transport protein
VDKLALAFAVAAVTFGTRVAGLSAGGEAIPEFLDRFLVYVPIAVFAALIVSSFSTTPVHLAPQLAGAASTIIAVRFFRQLWIGLVLGMLVYFAVRAVMPGI